MKNVLIAGGSGMIGGLILAECLQRDEVNKVTAVVRHSLGITHPKYVEVIHGDFLNYSTIEPYLQNQEVCFYCIGVYTGQVPTNVFKKITVDYTKAFAEALKKNSAGVTFCFLSGQGADASEKSRILFARQKGIAENILLHLGFKHTYIFRPGYIYPNIARKEPNFFYRIMRILYKPLALIYPNAGVTSKTLARKMVEIGLHDHVQTVFENVHIRK